VSSRIGEAGDGVGISGLVSDTPQLYAALKADGTHPAVIDRDRIGGGVKPYQDFDL
jgi:hypothetical protein